MPLPLMREQSRAAVVCLRVVSSKPAGGADACVVEVEGCEEVEEERDHVHRLVPKVDDGDVLRGRRGGGRVPGESATP